METLVHLFAIAADPASRPGGLARSDLLARLYLEAFVALINPVPMTVRIKDCDVWFATAASRGERLTFLGDIANQIVRARLVDPMLAAVLKPVRASGSDNATYEIVLPRDLSPIDATRLKDMLVGARTNPRVPENADAVNEILLAWSGRDQPASPAAATERDATHTA